jgi:hypothetical protein
LGDVLRRGEQLLRRELAAGILLPEELGSDSKLLEFASLAAGCSSRWACGPAGPAPRTTHRTPRTTHHAPPCRTSRLLL